MLSNVFAPVRADVVFALLRLFATFIVALVRAAHVPCSKTDVDSRGVLLCPLHPFPTFTVPTLIV